jgi:hypothetical protein
VTDANIRLIVDGERLLSTFKNITLFVANAILHILLNELYVNLVV